jgi:hypothetical protein
MNEQAYALAMYRVKTGQEDAFVSVWNEPADTFSSNKKPLERAISYLGIWK